MIAPAVLDALLASGATAEMIVAAVKAAIAEDACAIEKRRAADRERQKRHRKSRAVTVGHAMSRDVTLRDEQETQNSADGEDVSRYIDGQMVSPLAPPKVSPEPLSNNPPLIPPSSIDSGCARELELNDKPDEDRATKQKSKRTIAPETGWAPPQPEWADFVAHRNAKNKPMTPKAVKLNLAKLETLAVEGNDPRAVINQSIENGWTGLFAIKEETIERARQTGTDGIRNPILRMHLEDVAAKMARGGGGREGDEILRAELLSGRSENGIVCRVGTASGGDDPGRRR